MAKNNDSRTAPAEDHQTRLLVRKKKIHQFITSQHSGRPERIVRVSKHEVHDNHPRQTLGGIPYLCRRIYRPRGVDGMDRLRLKVSKDLGVESDFFHLNLFGLI